MSMFNSSTYAERVEFWRFEQAINRPHFLGGASLRECATWPRYFFERFNV